jgi:ribulose 1,5-bisphosphate carboxylase large subunit-like protein
MNESAIKTMQLQQKLKLSDFFQINESTSFMAEETGHTFSRDLGAFGNPIADDINNKILFFKHKETGKTVKLAILDNIFKISGVDISVVNRFLGYFEQEVNKVKYIKTNYFLKLNLKH